MKIFTKAFAIDTAERAINTFVQTMLGVLLVVGVGTGGFEAVQWTGVLSASGFAAFISILKCVSVATAKPEPQPTPVPEPVAPEDNLDARHRSTAIG